MKRIQVPKYIDIAYQVNRERILYGNGYAPKYMYCHLF